MPGSKQQRAKKPRLNLNLEPLSDREREITDQLMERLLGPSPVSGRPQPKIMDAHSETLSGRPQLTEMDAHLKGQPGRPLPSSVDAHANDVDANVSTKNDPVDAQTPTLERATNVDAHTEETRTPTKSDRHRATQMRWHFRTGDEIGKQFKVFCAQHGIEYGEFFERAGVHYMAAVDAHSAPQVDANVSHDDMMINRTHDDIIKLYREITGNKWKPADDRVAERFNGTHRRVLEIAMIPTALRAKRQIHSFKYFVEEIDLAIEDIQAAGLGEEALNQLHQSRRRHWEQKKSEAGK